MGRTTLTMRDRFDRIEEEYQPFRRSLRRRHQGAFDALFERARRHADAAGQQNPRDPWQAFVLTVLLAQERELRALREELAEGAERENVADGEGEERAGGEENDDAGSDAGPAP